MKYLILLTLTWKISFALNPHKFCEISENGNELYLNCNELDIEDIYTIRDESVSCGHKDVLRENIKSISIKGCALNDFHLFKNCKWLTLYRSEEIKAIQLNQFVYIEIFYKNFEVLPSAFSDLPNLREVDFSGYNLTLNESSFQGAHQLKKLNIFDLSISLLPSGLFHDLNHLEVLTLRINQTSNFSAIDFTGLENLKWLGVNTKPISDAMENRYIPKSLRYLMLQDNSIRDMNWVALLQLPNLILLDLSLNLIERLATNIFSELTNLRTLNLGGNSISRIEDGAFSTLKNLKKLNLCNNRLTFCVLEQS